MRIDQLNGGTPLAADSLIPAAAKVPVIQGGVTYPIAAQDLLAGGQAFIDPHRHGAKGDAVGNRDGVVTGGTTFSSPTYSFTAARVGQTIYVNGAARVITGVSNNAATLSSGVANATNVQWLVGTDDTAAIEAAMQAARTAGCTLTDGVSSESPSWGPVPFGGTVQLRAGRGYLVKNTQARFDAGKQGAIVVPRRCGLRGGGVGQTHVYLAPGNVGHAVTNENSQSGNGSYCDFVEIRDFTVFCNRGWQSSGCLDGIFLGIAFNGYVKTDVFTRVTNVRVFEAYRDGFYVKGRGEGVYTDVFCGNAARYGIYLDGTMDSRLFACNAAGSGRTGIRVNRSANVHLTNCKAFYSGEALSSGSPDSANFALLADTFVNGLVYLTACEAQESRGSGFYVESGMNVFNGCIASDPSRAALQGGTPPSVRAGFHLHDVNPNDSNPKFNRFFNCVVQPTLTFDYNNLAGPAFCGTHALYIDGPAAEGNTGDVWAYPRAAFSAAKVGGPGVTNGRNTGLRVDGVALT